MHSTEKSVAEHAELRKVHRSIATYNGPLDQLLKSFLRPSRRQVLLEYSVAVVLRSMHAPEYKGLFHFDSTHSLVLLYLGRPIAVISFIFREKDGCRSIRINQIQGVPLYMLKDLKNIPYVLGTDSNLEVHHKVSKKGLARIDWQAVLVMTVMLFAERMGDIGRVEIESSSQCNYSYTVCDIEAAGYFGDQSVLLASNARLKERYDETATRCGFLPITEMYVRTL